MFSSDRLQQVASLLHTVSFLFLAESNIQTRLVFCSGSANHKENFDTSDEANAQLQEAEA